MPGEVDIEQIIENAARQYNVDPNLVRAVMRHESGGRDSATSPQGAIGRMQLMPETARALGVRNARDPAESIPAATRLLSQLLDKHGTPELALMEYHGGPNRRIWGPRTQAYPGLVLNQYQRLTSANQPPAAQPEASAPANVQIAQTGAPTAVPPRALQGAPQEPQAPAMTTNIVGLPSDVQDFITGADRPSTVAPRTPDAAAPPVALPSGADEFITGPRPTGMGVRRQNSGIGERIGAGVIRGVRDVVDRPAEWLASGADAIGLNSLLRSAGLSAPTGEEVRAGNAQDRREFNELYGDSGGALTGRVAGNVAGTVGPLRLGAGLAQLGGAAFGRAVPAAAPIINSLTGLTTPAGIAARIGAGAAQGAAEGTAAAGMTLDPDQPVGGQLALGAGAGAVARGLIAPAAGAVMQRFAPHPDPNITQLAEDVGQLGVRIRGSQMQDPRSLTRRMDSLLEDTPLSGQAARNEDQARSWYRALSRQMGQDSDFLDAGVVRTALRDAGQRIEQAGNGIVLSHTDPVFRQRLNDILRDARLTLGTDRAAVIENQIAHIREVLAGGSGEGYRTLTTQGSPLSRLVRSRDTDVGTFARDIRSSLDDLLERSVPPDQVAALREARRHYYVASQLEPLAQMTPDGHFNPAALLSRVRDTNLPELRTLADAGRQFLGHFTGSPTEGRQWARRLMNFGPLLLETALMFNDPAMAAKGAMGLAASAGSGRVLGSLFNREGYRNRMIEAGRAARWGYPVPPGPANRLLNATIVPGTYSASRQEWDRPSGGESEQ